MSDLIDREKAIEQMSLYGSVWMDYTDDMTKEQVAEKALRASKQALIEAVKRLPSAQPDIIRCKDCDWWTKQEDSPQGRCALLQMYPTGGWFCGNARRREATA